MLWKINQIDIVAPLDFHENNMDGKGKLTLTDNSYYTGDFKNGKMHGFGKKVYENGDMCTGQF